MLRDGGGVLSLDSMVSLDGGVSFGVLLGGLGLMGDLVEDRRFMMLCKYNDDR